MLMIRGDKEDMSSLIDYLKEHKKIVIIAIIGGIVLASIPTGVAKKGLRIIGRLIVKLRYNPTKRLQAIKRKWGHLITKHSSRTGVPESVIASIIYKESVAALKLADIDRAPTIGRIEPTGRRCYGKKCDYKKLKGKEYAISYGLMQIIPYKRLRSGAKEIWNYSGNPFNLLDADTNIRVATDMLKSRYKKFNSWPLAAAAYNTNIANVIKAVKKYGNDWEKIVEKYALPYKKGFWNTNAYVKTLFAIGGIASKAVKIFI